MMNYYTGEIEDLRVGKVKKYLKDDKGLLDQYKNEGDREGLMSIYIRKYNEIHPIHIDNN
jgi:hypothetical protein